MPMTHWHVPHSHIHPHTITTMLSAHMTHNHIKVMNSTHKAVAWLTELCSESWKGPSSHNGATKSLLSLSLSLSLCRCCCLFPCQAELKRKCNIQHTAHNFNAAEIAKEMALKAETRTGIDQKASLSHADQKNVWKRSQDSWNTNLRQHGLCHLLFGAMKNCCEKMSKKEMGKMKLRRSR